MAQRMAAMMFSVVSFIPDISYNVTVNYNIVRNAMLKPSRKIIFAMLGNVPCLWVLCQNRLVCCAVHELYYTQKTRAHTNFF